MRTGRFTKKPKRLSMIHQKLFTSQISGKSLKDHLRDSDVRNYVIYG